MGTGTQRHQDDGEAPLTLGAGATRTRSLQRLLSRWVEHLLDGAKHLPWPLLRMRNDVHDQIPVSPDKEIKAPILVDARLPQPSTFVVFLGAKARCTCWDALAQFRSNCELRSAEKLHHAERLIFLRFNFLASSWSEAMNSLWVSKGPLTRLASTSASPSASWALTMRRCSGAYASPGAGSLG